MDSPRILPMERVLFLQVVVHGLLPERLGSLRDIAAVRPRLGTMFGHLLVAKQTIRW